MKCKWEECTIGDLCNTISDTYRGNDQYVVLVNTSDVLEGKVLNHREVKNQNLKGQFKKTFKKNDILYSEIRPANKRFAFVDFDDTSRYIASTKLMVLRSNERVLPEFLFALLKSNHIIAELQHLAETRSGTFPQITFYTELAPIRVKLPDKKTQKQIISIIKSFDDKIELNNAINNNLEQQAQAVYYKMFSEVNGEPVELSSIIDVRDGTHDSPKSQATGYYLITSKHLLPFGVDKASANRISKADFDKINERSLVETQDILMSMIGTIGLISYIPYEAVDFAIKNVALFKTSHTPELTYYFLCYLKSEKTLQHIEKCLAGSTQKYISLGELRKMPIYSLTTDETREFNYLVKPMFEEIVSRTYENALLAEMRDTLLPKLMSGEIDVSDIDL